jgi:hypothetical protein
MKLRQAIAVGLCAAVLGGSGCGSGKHSAEPSGSGTSSPAGADVTSTTTSGVGGHPKEAPPTLVDPKTGKQGKIEPEDTYTASNPPPAAFRPSDVPSSEPSKPNAIPLDAKITPPCVEHGQQVTFVFRSEPGITVAAQVKWPNDQFSDLDNTRGTTGKDGTFTWKVTVTPADLIGQADLQAAAIDEHDRSRPGTSGDWEFVVAPPGRC